MIELVSLQNQLQNYLLKEKQDIEQSVVFTERVPVKQRLFIYLDAYRSRLVDALGNNFPILQAFLGREQFYRYSCEYIDQFPSSYRSIRWYGDYFADYLKAQNEPFLAELAEFEWKMTLSFDAADDPTLKIEQMTTVAPDSWPNMRFNPHASLQRMDFAWNTVAIWEAMSHKKPGEKPGKNTELTRWVLWRHDYLNRFYKLAVDEAWALDALISGSTFAELCEGLCQWVDEAEVGMRAASFLKGWIQSGLIANIE